MSPLNKSQRSDKEHRSYEELGSYQSTYRRPICHTFMMPAVCSFSSCDFEQYHGLPFDMLPSMCYSQPEYTSECSDSGNDFYASGAADNNDYLYVSTQQDALVQPTYETQQQTTALQETLEPRMMFHHEMPVQYEEALPCFSFDPVTNFYQPEPLSLDAVMGSCTTITPQEQYFSHVSRVSPADSEASLSTPTSKYTEEEEEVPTMDKPYARLIYEALMQAPGHSMMLRDIYDWFAINTNKPRESGSNGWQNSIRHNLSMNQAFENDKTDTSARGHPRKANSIWVLTEHAVKHGVQSTTRYRKSGTVKKGSGHRTPATERQKSGSKGGKAARRAALLRRQEENSRSKSPSEPSFGCSTSSSRWLDHDPSMSPSDQISTPRYCPATPADECRDISSYELSHMSYSVEPHSHLKHEQSLPEDAHDLQYVSNSLSQELPRVQYGHDSLNIMFT